jgi:hypothetical protein
VRESDAIVHPILARCGVAHGFGTRTSKVPSGTFLPRQVHGVAVHHLSVDAVAAIGEVEADAICTSRPGQSIGIITADCVPILVCNESGQAVLAVHAGWRGLAHGVIEAGIASLMDESPVGEKLCAVVGPHVGPCCYEVDALVLDALRNRLEPRWMMLALRARALGSIPIGAMERPRAEWSISSQPLTVESVFQMTHAQMTQKERCVPPLDDPSRTATDETMIETGVCGIGGND